MAKKDTQRKLQEILDKKRKAEEELKAVKKQLAKEEREERRRCYLEIGKIVESCAGRNFSEEDIESFAAFARENEDLLKDIFDEKETSEAEIEEEISDTEIPEDEEEVSDTEITGEEDISAEPENAVSQEAPPFGA